MRWLTGILALASAGLVHALSASGRRVLVVADEVAQKDDYKNVWQSMDAHGYILSFQTPKSADLSLFKLGALAYDHLILLPSKSKGLGPNLTPNILVDFIKHEGNILVALSGDIATPSSIASFLLEFDITLPPERNAVVVDHFNFDKSAADKHDVLRIESIAQSKAGVRDLFKLNAPLVVPQAVGQVLGNANPLVTSIVKAPSTAYSHNPKETEPLDEIFASGAQLSLVSAFQARNSARLTVVGAAGMLQDAWTGSKAEGTGNAQFAELLIGWTFKELGVVKAGRITHYLNEEQAGTGNTSANGESEINPQIYRIKNDVTYSIELSEWDKDHYAPFQLPVSDAVQLEFSMLSPFHRLTLKETSRTANSTVFSTSFKLPDQHGIFNFLVNYKRPLLTNVYEKRTVTVRHFAHDEWPRSFVISAAYPWVAGIGVTVAGWLVFVALWLFSKPAAAAEVRTGKKTQ